MLSKRIVSQLLQQHGHSHPLDKCPVCIRNELMLERYGLLVRRANRALRKLLIDRRAAMVELKTLSDAMDDIQDALKIDTLNSEIHALEAPQNATVPPRSTISTAQSQVSKPATPPVKNPGLVRVLLARALHSMSDEGDGK